MVTDAVRGNLGSLIRSSSTFVRLERLNLKWRAFGKRGGLRAWGTDCFDSPEDAVRQLLGREEADGKLAGDQAAQMFRGRM